MRNREGGGNINPAGLLRKLAKRLGIVVASAKADCDKAKEPVPVPCSPSLRLQAENDRPPSTDSSTGVNFFVRWKFEGFILPRRLRMAIQSHLVELERKHRILENELHEALLHLSTDDLEIAELKRRKLMVKDEIERLKHQSDETFH
jgi:hypothetical protein